MKNNVSFACATLGFAALLGGCVSTAEVTTVENVPEDQPILATTKVSLNVTPLTPALRCFGSALAKSPRRGLSVAVGDIRDYTGKQTDGEGFAITQGGALMAYSALGQMSEGLRLHERFDTRIADAELAYSKSRQLGDGRKHTVDDPATGEQNEVPWAPYYGGTILKSDYYIVGGITELNYNIASGGAELAIGGVGVKRRTYTTNVAIDMRIVSTENLRVYDTVTVQKQITGVEVDGDIYRFFNSELFDFNAGSKSQEPLQLAVRMAIEAATLELMSSVTSVSTNSCLSNVAEEAKQ